jgi:predicted pyridoxine 5'-phosphate oxidase superfamily flavin-nucleotide-binding protein
MLLPEPIKDVFLNEHCHQLGTCSKDGIPNICYVGAKFLTEDGKIVIVDNYMLKTKDNVLENPNVSLLMRREKEAYQLKGHCTYLTEGALFGEARTWMKAKGEKYPAKGALVIEVEEIYNSKAGDQAGQKIC